VAVEEKSVIDYNAGNPDGILDAGEQPRPPNQPLVAIYPKEGTLYSDSPLITLDADWVDGREKEAAAKFVDFVRTDDNQEKVLEYGFRPATPDVRVADPISEDNGVNPAPPETLLDVPEPAVLSGLLDSWDVQRKSARVLMVMDVSGSMGDPGNEETGDTKLDLAKSAAISALDQFKDDDEVGLWAFSTELGPNGDQTVLKVLEPQRVGDVRERLKNEIGDLLPQSGTPLYDVSGEAYDDALAAFDPARINAVVLLSDGKNDDGDTSDDRDQLSALLNRLGEGSEGQTTRPVRHLPDRLRRRRRSARPCGRSPRPPPVRRTTRRTPRRSTRSSTR
jgi:Ca-activated chloride channel family protein